jgi:hypothetical protein
MPTVKGKKYPYTKAGKAAAKKAKGRKKGVKGLKDVAKGAVVGGMTGAGAGKVLKGLRKGVLKRTPSQIARIRAGGRNAKKKRKAGKGHQK